jgi:hypothetical protein
MTVALKCSAAGLYTDIGGTPWVHGPRRRRMSSGGGRAGRLGSTSRLRALAGKQMVIYRYVGDWPAVLWQGSDDGFQVQFGEASLNSLLVFQAGVDDRGEDLAGRQAGRGVQAVDGLG